MIMLAAAVGPAVALLFYFYLRDRYEKEPMRLLVKAFILGAATIVPAIVIETLISLRGSPFPDSVAGDLAAVGYTAFIVAGLVEEGLKYLAVYLFIYRRPEFNEMYDGIIYSVFVSLGFATIENIFYVASEGLGVAVIRAFTAVPAHALFGSSMGYYFGRAKFSFSYRKKTLLAMALIIPVMLHGIYDFILLSRVSALLSLFLPYIVILWIVTSRQIKDLSARSPFR